MQPVAFVGTTWGAAPPIVVTEPVEPRASSATRETEDCSAPQHLHRDLPDLEHVLLNSWVEYEWCITDAAKRLERQIDTRRGELTKAVDQLAVADQEGHVVISHAEFTRPPNVPPLSSGRIRKLGGVRWRREDGGFRWLRGAAVCFNGLLGGAVTSQYAGHALAF
jgi:hypothetical protein